jgi:hypothetical protein
VGQERLEDERVQGSRGLFDRARLARLFLDPVARDLVVLVEAEETGLASTLDELVGLGDELVCERLSVKKARSRSGRSATDSSQQCQNPTHQ